MNFFVFWRASHDFYWSSQSTMEPNSLWIRIPTITLFLVSKSHFLKFRSRNNQFSIRSISWNCQIIKSKWLMLLHDKSSSIVQCLLWTCSRLHINYLLFSTPSRWNFAAAAPQRVEIFSEAILLFWGNYPFQNKFKDRRNYVWDLK